MRPYLILATVLFAAVLPAGADDTYTAEELTALDRVLHAANLTREDLTFDKELAKGHACLPVVREMLRDPLTIARHMDRFAQQREGGGAGPAGLLALVEDGAAFVDPERVIPRAPPSEDEEFFCPSAAEYVAQWTEILRSGSEAQRFPDPETMRALRRQLPQEMAWHDVFETPFRGETDEKVKAYLEDKADDWAHATAARVDVLAGVWPWADLLHARVGELVPSLPGDAFPDDRPYIVPTPYGRIGLGTENDDVYEGEFAVLVDPGGNDRYLNCRIGAAYGTEESRLGFFADLGGDDVYECGDVNVTLGAAILGIAAFYDLGQGNDRYVGGHCSLGAAMGGVATFYDDGGTDTYEGRTFTQGAAGFGIGIFYDDAVQDFPETSSDEGTKEPVTIGLFDNDRLHAWSNAQAFARCKGVALCVNTRGNEVYEAGGVYLHAPLFADRYQSFSQGFAIGQRNIDYAGGVAMLIDHDGNDRYLGDVYNQGVGYWYGAGLLWDGGGNDTYEMTQYGQGSGIHLAVGGLVDVAGHDTYVMHSGLGQGSSHDYAASILHDRAGNDRYLGNTSCNGAALTNSVGLCIDRAGNDTYAGRRKGSINFGRPARGFPSIGVLLDLDGVDDYLGLMKDDSLWRHTSIGVGWDTTPPQAEEEPSGGGVTPAADQPTGKAEVPAICSYEGDLNQEVFDELWAIAVRWEVGDNRAIVPKARERLGAFGPDVLPFLDGKVEEGASGLELRAYVHVLKALVKAEHAEPVHAFLRSNFESEVERRNRMALYLTGELKVSELGEKVAAMLGSDDVGLARRAAGVLAALGSDTGNEVLRGWLGQAEDELRVQAALGTLLTLGADVYGDVRPLLDHPVFSVRTRLVELLVKHAAVYLDAVKADLMSGDVSERARRTILEVLVRTVATPDPTDAMAVAVLFEHPDWGMRADAVRLARAWEADESIDRESIQPALDGLERLREDEADPYVRFCLDADGR